MASADSNTMIGRVGVAVQEYPSRGLLSADQVNVLLQPIRESRVLHLDGQSHVSQQDIRAHLIRMFGFGNFDVEVISVELVYEEGTMRTPKRGGSDYKGWDVCYRALVRIVVRNAHGEYVAHYEDGSTATAQAQRSRGDAHDLAYKSAISLSVKRAATFLGDQFGLSLYNRGQTAPLVIRSMVPGVGAPEAAVPDLQEGIPTQVDLGNDEDGRELRVDAIASANPETGEVDADAIDWVKQAKDVRDDDPEYEAALKYVWETARDRGELTQPVKSAVLERKQEIDTHLGKAAAKPTTETPAEASNTEEKNA